jgi:hypothetical protein
VVPQQHVQAAPLAELHHQPHLPVGGVRADAVHRQDVVVGVQQQQLVQAALVVDGGGVHTVGAVALDGHHDALGEPLHELQLPKGATAPQGPQQ